LALIGDMVYLHDHETKASPKDVMRWCLVVALMGSQARVAPRSIGAEGRRLSLRPSVAAVNSEELSILHHAGQNLLVPHSRR
jgi:hypothetical protein